MFKEKFRIWIFKINLFNLLFKSENCDKNEALDIFINHLYNGNDDEEKLILAELYTQTKQYIKAINEYDFILNKYPKTIDLYWKNATLNHIIGDNVKCGKLASMGLEIDSENHHCSILLGISKLYLKNIEEAKKIFLNLKQDIYSKRWYLAYIYFLEKKYKIAWEYYDIRVKNTKFPEIVYKKPIWNGLPMNDKTILVIGEQGLGDNIMASRWFGELKNNFKDVKYVCDSSIKELMFNLKEKVEVLDVLDDSLNFDVWLPIMSLPYRLNLGEKEMEHDVPYFNIIKSSNNQLKKKIGINWIGSENHKNNRYRSILKKDYDLLKNLILDNSTIEWCSLVKGEFEDDCKYLGISSAVKDFNNLKQTADFLNNLDLVITIDTMHVHLAGALNIKTYLMLPWFPEWRWGLEGAKTIWYPSVEIFRQDEPFNWKNVIESINKKIKTL